MTATRKLRRETVYLAIQRGRKPIDAQVLDGLAIHKRYPGGYKGGPYKVSHVASGLSFGQHGFERLRDAKRFIFGMLDMNIDWSLDAVGMNAFMRDHPELGDAIRKLAWHVERNIHLDPN